MKWNKKGFTLIELLAVLVLLGVLSVLSLPILTRTINTSRNRMFVVDAKKLVAQAEYQMKSSSSDIIIPDEGDCIVISLAYLNTSAIKTGPSGGVYDVNSSFVVITNRGGTLEYSVSLVEYTKQKTYKGLALMRNESLYSINRRIPSEVVGFKPSELIDIDSISKNYINTKIKEDYEKDKKYNSSVVVENNYVSGDIAQIYHTQEIKDIASIVGGYTPIIKMIELRSKGNGSFGSLDASLVLKADDSDTPRKDLSIDVSLQGFGGVDTITYNYGENVFSSINIDFRRYGYNYLESKKVLVYVTVKDKDGNNDRRILDYTIHVNEKPVVLRSKLTPKDVVNNPYTGVLTLSLFDDLDDLSSLKVCFSENKDASSCSNYQSYASYFILDNSMDYTFQCNGTCQKDGLVHYLKVFIKDTADAITTVSFPYIFPKENRIIFDGEVSVKSKEETFTKKGSKNVVVHAKVKNPTNDIKICVSSFQTSEICFPYNNSNQYHYTINSTYDGEVKNIYVYAKNNSGNTSVVETILYTIYKDVGPTIEKFKLTSSKSACINSDVCGDNDNHLDANIDLLVNDDISSLDELRMCISEDKNYCQNTSNFKSYNEHKNDSFTVSGKYNGEDHIIYVYVRDGVGNTSEESTNYRVYNDLKPVFKGNPSVESSYNSHNIPLLDFYYYPDIVDDVDQQLTYQICYKVGNSEYTCQERKSNTGVFHLTKSFFDSSLSSYTGQVLTIYSTAKDSYHEEVVNSSEVQYALYNDLAPVIKDYNVIYQNQNATISFLVDDYMDSYQVGISVNGNCSQYIDTFYDGSNLESHTINYTYTGNVSNTTLCVNDKYNHVVSKTITPTKSSDYHLCSNVDTSNASYQYEAVSQDDKITKSRCNNKCYAYNPITKENNLVEGRYNLTITYHDAFQSSSTCPVNSTYTANCSFIDCFVKDSTDYYQGIGVVPYEDETPWSYELNGVTYINTYHYKAYQITYRNGEVILNEIENKKISPVMLNDSESMKDYVRVID